MVVMFGVPARDERSSVKDDDLCQQSFFSRRRRDASTNLHDFAISMNRCDMKWRLSDGRSRLDICAMVQQIL